MRIWGEIKLNGHKHNSNFKFFFMQNNFFTLGTQAFSHEMHPNITALHYCISLQNPRVRRVWDHENIITSQSGRYWVRSWWTRRCRRSDDCLELWFWYLRKSDRMMEPRVWSMETAQTRMDKSINLISDFNNTLKESHNDIKYDLGVFSTHHKREGLRRYSSILRETVPDTHLNMSVLYTITCGISQTTYNPEESKRERGGGFSRWHSTLKWKSVSAMIEWLNMKWQTG